MRSRIADSGVEPGKRPPVLTPMEKIRDFFGTRSWKLDIGEDGITSTHEEFDIKVEVKQEKVNFKVVAQAKDDPSDKLETITGDPMKELVDFIGNKVPGGKEFFKAYASNPALFSQIIRRASEKIRDLGPKRTATFVKQALLVLSFDSLEELVRIAVEEMERAPGDVETAELAQRMKNKGWEVKETKSETGIAGIKVDFHDLFDIEITPSSIEYEYEYIIEGYPESVFWGSTDDPIRVFEEWVKSDRFEKAREERDEDIDSGKLGGKDSIDSMKTIPSRKEAPGFAEAETIPSQRQP